MISSGKVSKKKISFLGGGAYTISNYRALLEALSEYYDITVFFEFYYEVQGATPLRFKIIPKRVSKFKKIRELYFGMMVLKNLLFNRPFLIHTHSTFPSGFWGIIAGKILGLRVIVSLDAAEASGLPEINFGDMLGARRKQINKWVINQADEVIVLTKFLMHEVQNNLKINRHFHIIPRGVDTHKFKYQEKEISAPLKIINVAYLNPVKDQTTLLHCFAILSAKIDCTLVHIGEDFHNGEIQKKVIEMGLTDKVKFLGLMANDKLPEYYHDVDILLHTSRYESQAVVVNEAMASGLIACGTHVGLLADLTDTCCLTVKPGDAKGLAEIVLRLLNDSNLVSKIRNNAYEWSAAHDLKWTVQQHRTVYELTSDERDV